MRATRKNNWKNVVRGDVIIANKQLPPEAYDNTPRAQLTFTDEAVWLSRFDPKGQVVSTYPVALDRVARAFVGVPASSGLLPRDALFWEFRNNAIRLGIYLPPQRRTLQFQIKREPETFNVPLPGFVFVGSGKSYEIFAALETPTAQTQLYRAPLPNVNPDGDVCTGTVEFPICTGESIHRAVAIFFDSFFNADLATEKLRDATTKKEIELIPRLRELSARRTKKFPHELLIAHGTLGNLIAGNVYISHEAATEYGDEDAEFDPERAADWGMNEGEEIIVGDVNIADDGYGFGE